MATDGVLARELATFERLREQLVGEALNKFALINGDDFVAAYDSENDAVNEGYRRFGREPFLVKQISSVDKPANFVSSLIAI